MRYSIFTLLIFFGQVAVANQLECESILGHYTCESRVRVPITRFSLTETTAFLPISQKSSVAVELDYLGRFAGATHDHNKVYPIDGQLIEYYSSLLDTFLGQCLGDKQFEAVMVRKHFDENSEILADRFIKFSFKKLTDQKLEFSYYFDYYNRMLEPQYRDESFKLTCYRIEN